MMSDTESVTSETLSETLSELDKLPLLPALKENGVNGQAYLPVEFERPIIQRMEEHEDPQVQLQSGLIRFSFVRKENVLFMLDFIPKILKSKEDWTQSRKTWRKITRVQAWNLFKMLKFVWNDLLTTEHRLPRGLTHEEMEALIDVCE